MPLACAGTTLLVWRPAGENVCLGEWSPGLAAISKLLLLLLIMLLGERIRNVLKMPSTTSVINFLFRLPSHPPVLILWGITLKILLTFHGNVKTGARGSLMEVNYGPCWSMIPVCCHSFADISQKARMENALCS